MPGVLALGLVLDLWKNEVGGRPADHLPWSVAKDGRTVLVDEGNKVVGIEAPKCPH